jgi:hypothetical protein
VSAWYRATRPEEGPGPGAEVQWEWTRTCARREERGQEGSSESDLFAAINLIIHAGEDDTHTRETLLVLTSVEI